MYKLNVLFKLDVIWNALKIQNDFEYSVINDYIAMIEYDLFSSSKEIVKTI